MNTGQALCNSPFGASVRWDCAWPPEKMLNPQTQRPPSRERLSAEWRRIQTSQTVLDLSCILQVCCLNWKMDSSAIADFVNPRPLDILHHDKLKTDFHFLFFQLTLTWMSLDNITVRALTSAVLCGTCIIFILCTCVTVRKILRSVEISIQHGNSFFIETENLNWDHRYSLNNRWKKPLLCNKGEWHR